MIFPVSTAIATHLLSAFVFLYLNQGTGLEHG